ncbi:MAG: prepilin-type N-terminal cleavage/methylation domain-containing protein [Gammaproteobacteria bacterium]|nr:prepilin-type N-terminal cleavage/methylation domain-containing protein [Gammaproteobacteria bacterium]MXY57379.1 prepilin-type N-terminal cleavage/methylation domain-containing protein [Gammaproteobacteria bacterium]MYF31310.1 prepilin-type N-terminal cleavage/methylation domain-containing protein [Gammaproteobacteria bacterium]MYK47795.1 prepilin-type N-terminal cleavage/methylation domain-containing protein [Gammaproteobacteria bacterium]
MAARRGVGIRGRLAAGFSLLELLIALAVIAVVAAIAVPVYRDYVATARDAALVRQVTTIEVFQEDYKLRTATYGAGRYDAANGIATLTTAIDWKPSRDDGVVYEVTANGGENWMARATDSAGRTICRVFPGGRPCG